MPQGEITYLQLIRRNVHFRRLWASDVVSLLGDWFNTIAIYALVEELTSSPFALGLVFAIKMGSYAIASPLAGVLADRYNRRRLMIAVDLMRAVVVLGFLFIDSPEQIWVLYILIAAQMVIGAAFRPARSASVPNVVRPEALLTANALMAATWSSLLAIGAALGGFAAGWLGNDAVFIIDACTYLVSAFFLYRAVIPQPSLSKAATTPLFSAAWGEIRLGWRYLLDRRDVLRMALAKATWSSGGSALVYMLAVLGPEVTGPGGAPIPEAFAIGLLFSARGLGTGVGPIVGRALFRNPRRWPLILGIFMVISGFVYSMVGFMEWTLWVMVPIALAHTLSGTNWVFSSVLLQQRAEDAFRGRVFATEWLMLTLVNVVATLSAGALLEWGGLSLREAIFLFCGVIVVMGIGWLVLVVPRERAAAETSA